MEKEVTVTVQKEEAGVWALCLSRDLYGICDGENMALLLRIHAPHGSRIAKVETASGADGLVVTVGESGGDSVTVLLDGRPFKEEGEPSPLLRVFPEESVGETGRGWEDPDAYPTVTAGGYGDLAVYVMGKEGVEVIPLRFMPPKEVGASGEISVSGTGETGSETSEETAEPTETLENAEWPEESTQAESPGTDDGSMPPEAGHSRFMGCRETAVRNGRFTVEFLFRGKGKETPVHCAKGGGLLTLTVYSVETLTVREGGSTVTYGGEWRVCKFSGLSSHGQYLFFVDTGEEYVEVLYVNGCFAGFEKGREVSWG